MDGSLMAAKVPDIISHNSVSTTSSGVGKSVGDNREERSKNERKRQLRSKYNLKIAAFNVRTLATSKVIEKQKELGPTAKLTRPPDKVPFLAVELADFDMDICCLAEVRRCTEQFEREGFRFFCSGGSKKEHGVGVVVRRSIITGEVQVCSHSDRIMYVSGVFKGVQLGIIAAYSPTNVSHEATQEEFYRELDIVYRKVEQDNVNIVVCGDFNARIGQRDTFTWRSCGRYCQ
jgi:exonuclease III